MVNIEITDFLMQSFYDDAYPTKQLKATVVKSNSLPNTQYLKVLSYIYINEKSDFLLYTY